MARVTYDFTGNNYVVTGASSGIGRQIVIELAEAGATVLAIARREDKLRELTEIYPRQIELGVVDVRSTDAIKSSVENFVKKHGKLDGGVHAAGIVAVTSLRSYDEEIAHSIMDISFWGMINFMQVCSKAKLSNTAASYVLFSSTAASEGLKGKFAYSAAKAAVNTAAKSIAKELARRQQRVNTVMPGWVNTSMTQETSDVTDVDSIMEKELLGVGQPTDVTGLVLFLLSDRSSWMTGSQIPVDGGYLA